MDAGQALDGVQAVKEAAGSVAKGVVFARPASRGRIAGVLSS